VEIRGKVKGEIRAITCSLSLFIQILSDIFESDIIPSDGN
jgi:hypothetical protein